MVRLRELAIEAVMVVFAVMVALAVDEWRDEKDLRELAEQAHSAVMTEVQANLDELGRVGPSISAIVDSLGPAVKAGDVSGVTTLAFDLPEISSAAWTAAQVSRAAPYLDYDWMIRVARAYEAYGAYERLASESVDDVAEMIGGGPTIEGAARAYGHLVVLLQVHNQLEDRFRALAEGG